MGAFLLRDAPSPAIGVPTAVCRSSCEMQNSKIKRDSLPLCGRCVAPVAAVGRIRIHSRGLYRTLMRRRQVVIGMLGTPRRGHRPGAGRNGGRRSRWACTETVSRPARTARRRAPLRELAEAVCADLAQVSPETEVRRHDTFTSPIRGISKACTRPCTISCAPMTSGRRKRTTSSTSPPARTSRRSAGSCSPRAGTSRAGCCRRRRRASRAAATRRQLRDHRSRPVALRPHRTTFRATAARRSRRCSRAASPRATPPSTG